MNYVILDLEATCWQQRRGYPNEIIEIGAVKVNQNKEIIDEFQRFVRPIRFPELSEFCKDLTSITQEQVDEAAHFYEIIEEFKNWVGYAEEKYYLCSWGFYDRNQLEKDSRWHNLEISWLSRHISLKHQYRNIQNLRRAIGMKNALKMENIPLDGTHHRGIDDARNITKIFLKHFEKWDYSLKE